MSYFQAICKFLAVKCAEIEKGEQPPVEDHSRSNCSDVITVPGDRSDSD